MKNNRLQKYESKIEREPSPEQLKQAREWAVNRIMEVVDKLPANPAPVVESFAELAELARQANSGVRASAVPTLIISGDEKTAVRASDSLTLYDSGGEENSGKNKFTDLENALLEQIRNGEQ
jgi:alpha-beta hydrolase superfamily lysophospholipase